MELAFSDTNGMAEKTLLELNSVQKILNFVRDLESTCF